MDEFDDMDAGLSILPGVDLTLWLRLALLALVLVVAGALAAALH